MTFVVRALGCPAVQLWAFTVRALRLGSVGDHSLRRRQSYVRGPGLRRRDAPHRRKVHNPRAAAGPLSRRSRSSSPNAHARTRTSIAHAPRPRRRRTGDGGLWAVASVLACPDAAPLVASGSRAAVRRSDGLRGRLLQESAIYISYMAPRAQYVRLPGPFSVSGGSGGRRNPVSPLFSTGGRSPNPTLSAK
jgi:hypothetical protein